MAATAEAIGSLIAVYHDTVAWFEVVGNDAITNGVNMDLVSQNVPVPAGYTNATIIFVANVRVTGTQTAGDLATYAAALTAYDPLPASVTIATDSGGVIRGVPTFVMNATDIVDATLTITLSANHTLTTPAGKYPAYGWRTTVIFTK
jgi:hypothetical protein